MLSQQACFHDAPFSQWNQPGGITHRQWQGNANALRPFHHVRVGHDVTVRVDDHSGSDRMLPNDERGLRAIAFARGGVTGNKNLYNRRRHFGGKPLQGVIELNQDVSCPIRVGLGCVVVGVAIVRPHSSVRKFGGLSEHRRR